MEFKTNIPGFPDNNEPENFTNIVLSVDTNYLLSLLTVNEEDYNFLYKILDDFNSTNKLFITYHTAHEYFIEAESICRKDGRLFESYQDKINSTFNGLKTLEKTYKDKVHNYEEINIEIEKINKNFQSFFGKKLIKPDYAKRAKSIEKLFKNMGQPYSHEKLLEVMKEIEFRYAAFIAPGFDDKTKENGNKYGDCLIWFQLMDYAKIIEKDIIFITSERKLDWCIQGDFRKELFIEFYNETKHKIYIYTPDDFITIYRKLSESKEDTKIPAKSMTELLSPSDSDTTLKAYLLNYYTYNSASKDLYNRLEKIRSKLQLDNLYKYSLLSDDDYLYNKERLLDELTPSLYANYLNREIDTDIALKYLQGKFPGLDKEGLKSANNLIDKENKEVKNQKKDNKNNQEKESKKEDKTNNKKK